MVHMKPRYLVRRVVNWVTLSTPFGLLIAVLGRAKLRREKDGLWVAEHCRLMLPDAGAFTVGNVVITGGSFDALASHFPEILDHEAAHSSQWSLLGPLFLPLYVIWMVWSMLRTGNRATRNYLERWAGLKRGGYDENATRPKRRRSAL